MVRSAPRRLPTTQGRVQALDPLHGGRLFSWSVASFPIDATVWRSEDGGTSWKRFPVPLNPALDPVLELAATGAVVGVDIFGLSTTTDGGRTWTQHPTLPPPGLVESPVDRRIWPGLAAFWTVSPATRWLPA